MKHRNSIWKAEIKHPKINAFLIDSYPQILIQICKRRTYRVCLNCFLTVLKHGLLLKRKSAQLLFLLSMPWPKGRLPNELEVAAVGFNITLSKVAGCVTQISTPRWSLRKTLDVEGVMLNSLVSLLLFPSGKPHIRESQSENNTLHALLPLLFEKVFMSFSFHVCS